MESMQIEEIDIGIIESFLIQLPEKIFHMALRVVLALVVFLVGVQLIKFVRRILKKSLTRAHADVGVIQFLDSFVKIGLYVVLILFILTGFGVEAASIIAVIGSAGVALGLALQGSLSNLAGGVLILLLKPFRVGDYIIEDSNKNEGTVSEIQIFYTKLTTPDNRVIVLPNGTLANTSLTNVTDTPYRRMDIRVGISYDSDIRKGKEVVSRLLEEDEKVLKDKERMVFVDTLGDSAVIIGVRCWFLNEDFWAGKYRITEQIKYALDENGIGIPYPQLDVHLQKTDLSKIDLSKSN